jgi:glutaredoxin
VEIAVLSGCPYSARALRMLRTLGIPHQVVRVDGEDARRHLLQRSGQRSMPQVFIDGEFIGGYDALAERHGLGELDALRGH